MTDIAALVTRLRDEKPLPWRYVEEAADALEACQDEIERLRKHLEWSENSRCRANDALRADALEEAAKVAHEWDGDAAAAIRALKEKASD